MVILVRVVALKVAFRRFREEIRAALRQPTMKRTDGPSGACVEIRLFNFHISRGIPDAVGQQINSEPRSKNQNKQPEESRLIRRVYSIRRSASRSNPNGLTPTGQMTYNASSYPCLSSACAKASEKQLSCRSGPVERSLWAKCISGGHLGPLEGCPVAGLTSFWCKSFATGQEDKPHLSNNLFLATCRLR